MDPSTIHRVVDRNCDVEVPIRLVYKIFVYKR